MPRSVYSRFGTSQVQGKASRRRTVVADQTIPFIASEEYPNEGYSAEAWRQIAEYNEIEDLDEVTAGTVLSIPPLRNVATDEE